jgi:predicted acyltransferase
MNAPQSASTTPATDTGSSRLVSLDALRGFDMFWILGGDSLAYALGKISNAPWARVLSEQLDHVAWEGFHFYDLVFPLFVFLMGVSTVFSLGKHQESSRQAAYVRLLRRSLLLYLLGLFYYGGRSLGDEPEMFRYVGVLQRIAICYLFTGLAVMHLSWRGIVGLAAALLVGYWAAMNFVPVPGFGAGVLEEGKNLANYVDQRFLPGFKWDGDGQWDPEGLLSNVPAIASGLLGALAGIVLRQRDVPGTKRAAWLVMAGLACLALGWLWGLQFPIIKKLWTSSYVLVAGGYSFLLLALFYLVIDVWGKRRWAEPFLWIGANSITIYLLAELLDFSKIVRRVLHQDTLESIAPYGDLLVALLSLALAVWICRELYRRKIFLRV